MNRSLAFVLIAFLALCGSQVCPAAKKESAEAKQKKNPEANKLALEGAQAAKSQDWNKAVDLLKKATAMDHKWTNSLGGLSTTRIRGCKRAEIRGRHQRLQRSAQTYSSDAPRIHEQRAAVEMKIQDYDKALADYSELIKLKPNEIKYINYRAVHLRAEKRSSKFVGRKRKDFEAGSQQSGCEDAQATA